MSKYPSTKPKFVTSALVIVVTPRDGDTLRYEAEIRGIYCVKNCAIPDPSTDTGDYILYTGFLYIVTPSMGAEFYTEECLQKLPLDAYEDSREFITRICKLQKAF